MKLALFERAETILVVADRKQPDWFREYEAAIKPVLKKGTGCIHYGLVWGWRGIGKSMLQHAGQPDKQ